jgi:hypothetical protein
MADPLAGYHPRAVLLVRALGRPLRRASLAGSIAGIVAGSVIMYGLPTLSWPIAAVFTVLVTVGIGVAMTVVLLPTDVRRALDAFGWLWDREIGRFRERTGSDSTARNAADVVAWLDANPAGPVTGVARVEMLLSVGRLDEARLELTALGKGSTELERLEVASLRAFAEILETGSFDEAAYDDVAREASTGTGLALEAAVSRAVLVSRSRLALGQADPLGPLVAIRRHLGFEATRIAIRRTWLGFLRGLALFGVGIALVGYVVRGGLYGLLP